MLTLCLLLIVSLVLQCVCDDSSLCNEVKLKPSEYEIKSNNTVFISVANLTIFNATLKGNDICVPLSKEFLNCKVKQLWYKYLVVIELNLNAKVSVLSTYFDPTNYMILQNGSLVVCCPSGDVISEWRLYVAYWIYYGFNVISAVTLIVSFGLNLKYFQSNCQSKCLICHLGSLTTLFIFYTVQPYVTNFRIVVMCYFVFFMVYYPMVASIFWCNAISIEMWYLFSQMQTSPYNIPSVSSSKRWRIYQLYAWGTPLTMATMVIISDWMPIPPSLTTILDPQLKLRCWMNNQVFNVVFYYAPVGLATLFTLIFFGLTVHIIKYASVGTVDFISYRRNRTLYVSLKLIVVTGIFWIALLICDIIGWGTLMWDGVYYRFGFFIYLIMYGQGIVIGLVYIDRLQLGKKLCRKRW
ncbi:hypothetical protein CHUAL_012094 [Chamberlinius hualienensis]